MFALFFIMFINADFLQTRHNHVKRPSISWVLKLFSIFVWLVISTIIKHERNKICLIDMYCTGEGTFMDVLPHAGVMFGWIATSLIGGWYTPEMVHSADNWITTGGFFDEKRLIKVLRRFGFALVMASAVAMNSKTPYLFSDDDGYSFSFKLFVTAFLSIGTNPILLMPALSWLGRWYDRRSGTVTSDNEDGREVLIEKPKVEV